jgi:hypothetical protein
LRNVRAETAHKTLLLSYAVPRAFLIDTDVASDDAVALIMALRAPDVRVVAITSVAGNVAVQQAARNALYLGAVAWAGAWTPKFYHPPDHLGEMPKGKPTTKPADEDSRQMARVLLATGAVPPASSAPARDSDAA